MLVSIVTATYNRAATLPTLYASIAAQGVDVEWVVVDDGSTDETPDLMADLTSSAPFPIRHLSQPNRGKHTAVNRGVPLARGELVALVDSDDELVPGGIARLLARWNEIPSTLRDGFFGVVGRCVDDDGHRIGDDFPGPAPIDCSWHDAVYIHRATGDRSGLLRADILRAHPFPEPAGQNYVFEGMVWREIGCRYQTRYVDDPLVQVHTAGSDRLSHRRTGQMRRPVLQHYSAMLTEDLAWFRHAPSMFLRAAVQYTRCSLGERIPLRRQVADLSGPARILWASALPVGTVLWLQDQRSSPAGSR